MCFLETLRVLIALPSFEFALLFLEVELTWICELVSDEAYWVRVRIARGVSNDALSIMPVPLLAMASGQS